MNSSESMPPEWHAHDACWLAWPAHADLWGARLPEVQKEFTELCRWISQSEKLEVLVSDSESQKEASKALSGLPARFHEIPYGDIWLRDTAPVFIRTHSGTAMSGLVANCFVFNGWGGKYQLPHDTQVAERIAQTSGIEIRRFPWVLEGGSVEFDGEGTCLTTRQCLLNSNRHPNKSSVPTESTIEARLQSAFGIQRVLWLDQGLENDHTDGHIDTLARFCAPGTIACMEAHESDDPNRQILANIARALRSMKDTHGQPLKVVTIPSPGRVEDDQGKVMAASYINFYISNQHVVVPTYGTKWDSEAVRAISALFPNRKTVGVSARAILEGGGAFHCITQQQPQVSS